MSEFNCQEILYKKLPSKNFKFLFVLNISMASFAEITPLNILMLLLVNFLLFICWRVRLLDAINETEYKETIKCLKYIYYDVLIMICR